jgi:hypothetical protein
MRQVFFALDKSGEGKSINEDPDALGLVNQHGLSRKVCRIVVPHGQLRIMDGRTLISKPSLTTVVPSSIYLIL